MEGEAPGAGDLLSMNKAFTAAVRCRKSATAAELALSNAVRLSTFAESVDDSFTLACSGFRRALVVPWGELAGAMFIARKHTPAASPYSKAFDTTLEARPPGACTNVPCRR